MIAEADLPRNIWRHHLRVLDAFSLVERALLDTGIVAQIQSDNAFYGMTSSQAGKVLREMEKELKLQTSLALLAGFEAIIRTDYVTRAKGKSPGKKLPPPVTTLWTKTGQKARLDSLLDAWKVAVHADAHVVGAFKSLFDLRHWLAHGRHWPTKGFATKDTHEVLKVARALQKAIPELPTLVDW